MKLGPEHNREPEGTPPGAEDRLEPLPADSLEQDLFTALRHVDAPEGFADRLMARALQEPAPASRAASRGKLLARPVVRPWLGGAVAAALIAGLFATETAMEHHRARERRVQQATEQFETAERITDHALEQARRQIDQAQRQIAATKGLLD